jgi:hypothetical protein
MARGCRHGAALRVESDWSERHYTRETAPSPATYSPRPAIEARACLHPCLARIPFAAPSEAKAMRRRLAGLAVENIRAA